MKIAWIATLPGLCGSAWVPSTVTEPLPQGQALVAPTSLRLSSPLHLAALPHLPQISVAYLTGQFQRPASACATCDPCDLRPGSNLLPATCDLPVLRPATICDLGDAGGCLPVRPATCYPLPATCQVMNGSNYAYVAGGLAYEASWRCVYFDPTSPNQVSISGPGNYSVLVGNVSRSVATPMDPFPNNTAVPPSPWDATATCCQHPALPLAFRCTPIAIPGISQHPACVWDGMPMATYTEIVGGLPAVIPIYGTALVDKRDGNFYCHAAVTHYVSKKSKCTASDLNQTLLSSN
eukprot:gene6412-1143_t